MAMKYLNIFLKSCKPNTKRNFNFHQSVSGRPINFALTQEIIRSKLRRLHSSFTFQTVTALAFKKLLPSASLELHWRNRAIQHFTIIIYSPLIIKAKGRNAKTTNWQYWWLPFCIISITFWWRLQKLFTVGEDCATVQKFYAYKILIRHALLIMKQ